MRKVLILIAAAALLCTAAPAMAADWEFFGIANIRTQWMSGNDRSKDGTQLGAPEANNDDIVNILSDDDLQWGRMLTGAIGATVQAGDIGGKFNIRVLEGTGEVNTTPGNFTELYGTWNFGPGELLVGKTLTPINFFPSAQVSLDDFGLVGLGGLLSYFKPMLQASFNAGPGQLKIALIENEAALSVRPFNTPPSWENSRGSAPDGSLVDRDYTRDDGESTTLFKETNYDDADVTFPKIEVSYQFDIASHSIWLGGGYQTYEVSKAFPDKSGLASGADVDSYVLGLGWLTNWGPFYFNGDVFIGQNLGQYQMTFQQGDDDARARFDANGNSFIDDNESIGFSVVAGWKFNDMLKIEAGYGYLKHKLDGSVTKTVNATSAPSQLNPAGTYTTVDPEDDMQSFYVQLPITLSPGMMIIPEVSYFDWGDNEISPRDGQAPKDDEGSTTYIGATWRITF
jgi:hypothetical protein